MKEVRYGVISDLHVDPRIIVPALKTLMDQSVDKLIINGDIGGWRGDLQSSQAYTGFILDKVARTSLEAFVQPGSHEPIIAYGPVVDYFSEKFGNIVNVINMQRIEQDGHTLVFLPGSDFTCGGEYQIGSRDIKTGMYVQMRDRTLPAENWKDVQFLMNNGGRGMLHYSNMNDLRKLVTSPDNTIVVCHVPRKFSGLDTCVDMAEFGEVAEEFNLNGEGISKGSVFPINSAVGLARAGYPVQIKKENRGNKELAELYDEIGITKAVTGHFHESSHRANNRAGNHVAENVYTNELFWNSGHLDQGHLGILTVRGSEAKYQNINL